VQANEAAAVVARRVEDYEAHSLGGSAVTAAGFLASRSLHELKAQGILAARDVEAVAWDAVSERLHDWSGAAQRVSALERLDERRREEYELELRRDEDAQVDDLVVSRQRATVRS
jgi:flagellar export protein FliJ